MNTELAIIGGVILAGCVAFIGGAICAAVWAEWKAGRK